MGQKSNPIILRLNKTNQHWNSCWYSDDNYATSFIEDCKINPYINSSQQQLERFPPLSFVKRQRGDLQLAFFSAKPAQQFSKFKDYKYKKGLGHLITHDIFKKWARYEKPINKLLTPYDDPINARAESRGFTLKKKECFRSRIFLAMGSKYNAGGVVSECRAGSKSLRHVLSGKTPSLFARKVSKRLQSSHNLGIPSSHHPIIVASLHRRCTMHHAPCTMKAQESIKLANEKGGRGVVKIFSPLINHLEYSIDKYYNEYQTPSFAVPNGGMHPLRPVRSRIYLIKSPSIYQNPLFLASQVVSLLEERAVFRQIKHRVVKEIRKNPIIKGVRIICSGRVASRSKKAQKARRESIQWGATSLNVFSEHVNFAGLFAQTAFGKIGVKVWISYNPVA